MTDAPAALGVDVGGTFTDVALLTGGDLTTVKVATTETDQSLGVRRGIERACDEADLDPDAVGRFRHASTVATNALLEGEGARTALVTTAGFGDVVEIGRQDRLELYDPSARTVDPLVPEDRRFEVAERATPDGIEDPVDDADLDDLTDRLEPVAGGENGASEDGAGDDPVGAIAVSFLHAYAAPANERRVAEHLRGALDVPVSVSHEVIATFREYERTATTVADATVTPVIDGYLGDLVERAASLGLPAPRVMRSSGGIADLDAARSSAVTTALSGPAAGVVGASLFEPAECPGVISFDMGGTSTDVGLVREGEVAETSEADVGGHPVHVPMVDVETVGAGGGSIARVDDGGALRVGPDSAGADPGPACYGRGGTEPTVTDAAVVLGHLDPEAELGLDVRLDADRARTVLADLAEAAGLGDATAAAEGVHAVANARMAGAIRTVTTERGHDLRDFAVVAFGGAGPMHAAALADRLGVETVLVPRANGVLSALGLLAADERHDAARTHRVPLAGADAGAIESLYEGLESGVRADAESGDPAVGRLAECRYAGQSYELPVAVPAPFDRDAVAERFHAVHDRKRGFALPEEPVELVTLRVSASVRTDPPDISHVGTGDATRTRRPVVFDGVERPTPVWRRAGLSTGTAHAGPAVFEGDESTVVVPPDWRTTVDERGTLVLEAAG
jgi:N-methylhydantoinase A